MLGQPALNSALRSLSLVSINRYVSRFIPAVNHGTALAAVGAIRVGGRYNPPGIPALYTAFRRATALAEATQFFHDDEPIRPMLMLAVRVDSNKIADLTNSDTERAIATNREELTALILDRKRGNASTQILGRVAYETDRIDGLIVWSRILRRSKNLVLFPDRLGMAYELYDPKNDLSSIHPDVMAAMNHFMGVEPEAR